MFKLVLSAVLLLSCQGASFGPKTGTGQGRIVGGELIEITDAPYVVALLYDALGIGRYNLRCTGSILSESVIVTTARCLKGTDENQWKVHAGSSFIEIEGQYMNIESIIIHENFDSNLDNDIGLIVLSVALHLDGEKTAAISLPTENFVLQDNDAVSVTGFGSLEEGGAATGYLLGVTLKIVNQLECRSIYFNYNTVTERMVCAGNMAGGEGICDGDVGGPIVKNNILVGISSWSKGCAVVRQPAVGTRVSSMVPWILSNMPKTAQ